VIKVRTWFTLLLLSFGTVAATVSCGSDEATGGGGGTGGGGLLPGGGKGGASSGGAVGRAGSTAGGGDSSTSNGILGTVCAVDGDCGTGLTCITAGSAKFGGGGPSQGLCTAACATSADCDPLETGAGCVDMGTVATPAKYCLESCAQGDPLDITTKCQGRVDFACTDLAVPPTDPKATAVPNPFCTPRCRMDDECGTGLFCSPRTGLCSKTKPTGDPAGTPCDGTATTNNCAGICVRFSTTSAFCADVCSGELPCGYGSGTTPGGLCAGAFSTTFGALDEGFCESNCTCSGECKFPTDICRGWMSTESTLESALGAPGLCYPPIMPSDGSVELTACEGGAGGATGTETGGSHAGGVAAGGAAAGGAAAGGSGGAPAAGGAGAPAAGGGGAPTAGTGGTGG
jgi:hypothetical protein